MTLAFDDDERYELTELGTQFVRYTMEGVMPRIGSTGIPESPPNAAGQN